MGRWNKWRDYCDSLAHIDVLMLSQEVGGEVVARRRALQVLEGNRTSTLNGIVFQLVFWILRRKFPNYNINGFTLTEVQNLSEVKQDWPILIKDGYKFYKILSVEEAGELPQGTTLYTVVKS